MVRFQKLTALIERVEKLLLVKRAAHRVRAEVPSAGEVGQRGEISCHQVHGAPCTLARFQPIETALHPIDSKAFSNIPFLQ